MQSNETDEALTGSCEDCYPSEMGELFETMEVTGREDTFLKMLASKMNFKIEYVDPPEKVQGVQSGVVGNLTFSGELGMLQRRVS